jgi:hypothetical protein
MIRRSKLFTPVILAFLSAGVMATTVAKAQSPDLTQASVTAKTMIPAYDVNKEVRIQGTIQKIDAAGTSGLTGTHILLQTANGIVDAHLGFGAASKPAYLGIAAGQKVIVTGMMESLGTGNVLLARILTTSNHIFVLRNEQGIPVRATPRGSAAAKALQKGL